ncbi:MAG: hypothetical protein M3Q07_04755 [Pseudobdellovibrionaceae bacterium]|nr:hypothetical protein [Pseudobdellovibrionaceae bacterium]
MEVSVVLQKTIRCPHCEAALLKVYTEEFQSVQSRYWTEGGDWLSPTSGDDFETAPRDQDVSIGWGKCKECKRRYYTVDAAITAKDQSAEWWFSCMANDREKHGPNYLIEGSFLPATNQPSWVMFSEIYKGVRLDTHILGPFKDLDEKQASENFFAIKSQLKELAQVDVRVKESNWIYSDDPTDDLEDAIFILLPAAADWEKV